jgi:lipopolysaccharide/colanic/teichoic acid biosynthesis glycosyltransferase
LRVKTDLFLKRLFDLSVSILGLIILMPLLIVLAILIKLNDKGPVLFCQKRIGMHGIPFNMYKFRSMKVIESAEEGLFRPGNRSRVTSPGKFLRRTKLDELPQLINVLKGDMSLVGPRPEVEEWVAVLPDKWRLVLTVRPGITDNASIVFRNEEELLSRSLNPEDTYRNIILPRKLDLYTEYVINHTFMGDISIIFCTIKTILYK